MAEPTPAAQVAPAQPKSHFVRNVIVIVLVLGGLAVFFYGPVVPYTFAKSDTLGSSFSSYLGSGYSSSITASVSPSYAIFSCGEVWNPSISVNILGSQISYQGWNGGRWFCS